MRNQSTIKPTTIHSDTQGQNLPVFGLAYLLGIELMPRIRNWKGLRFYRSSKDTHYDHIDSLFGDNVVDWDLIATHWQDLLRVVISIQEGKVLPSMLLRKLTTYSRKNRLYQAFHALGTIVRTCFLLTFISDEKLREVIHRSTNKVEQYNAFEDWITFAGAGTIYERAYIEQEKRIKYTGLIANCVMLDNTVEISNALNALARERLIPTIDDEHDMLPLFRVSHRHRSEEISERSISTLPGALDHSGDWFFRNEGVPKYVPQVLSKYVKRANLHQLLC